MTLAAATGSGHRTILTLEGTFPSCYKHRSHRAILSRPWAAVMPDGWVWHLVATGGVLGLTAFLASALAALPRGVDAAIATRGAPFPWPVYLAGLALGSLGLLRVVAHYRIRPASGS